MLLIVGLGNPGEKFGKTRHNLGFRVLDKFQKENNFPEFALSKKFNSLISEGEINGKQIILAKPQTFMNSSGQAVKKFTTHYSLPTTNLIIIHDDIDILLGEVKISQNKNSAGHKGVESIINLLGAKDFKRIRLGIRPIEEKPKETEKFVLQKFSPDEEKILETVLANACRLLNQTLPTGDLPNGDKS